MEKVMKHPLPMIATTAFLFLAVARSDAATIGFEPSSFNATVGSMIELRVVISELGAGVPPSLSAFDLDIAFNDDVLSFENATFGDPTLGDQLDLTGLGSLTLATPGLGIVNLLGLSFDSPLDLDALQADSFVLATLVFRAVDTGISVVEVATAVLGDAGGNALSATFTSSSVSVAGAPVPEPGSVSLALAGAAVFSVWRRSRLRGYGRS
jgi:hypothetical protein